jgi:hypothetical protein
MPVILMCAAMACLAAAPSAARAGDRLLGNWSVTLVPSGTDANQPGVKQFDETLTFTTNQFSTKVLAQCGFGPTDYQEDSTGYGPSKFSCTQTSDKEGKIAWQGTSTGQDITGTLVWTRKDGSVIHYDFQGSKSS